MCSPIELLELRLKYIEDRLFGNKANAVSLESGQSSANNLNLSEQLLQMESKLKELTTGKERFNNCFKKSLQLDKWLDNEYVDRMVATDLSKYEEVLSFEDQIRSEAQMFESIEELVRHLDSPHIRNYDKLEPKLNEIRSVALNQSQDSNPIEDKTKQLLLAYNEWLSLIKKQLTLWDQKLSQLEDKKGNKKTSNKTQLEID